MLKLEWVNHASFIIDDGEMRMITDPWLEGSVFNESWSLISKTQFTYHDFKNINYIWFSHEHPDHFFPPNLKKIPEEYRKNITIVFHKTKDRKVAKFCEYLGFNDVIELGPDSFELSDHTKIYIEKFDDYSLDSWFFLESRGKTFLNVNDCVLNSKNLIQKLFNKVGKVDFLFTQFSYANWVGNPEDKELRLEHAKEKFRRIHNQIEIFRPAYFIPFASFVYFSHEENFFMNDTVNTITKTYNEFKNKVDTLILYPGDIYTIGNQWNKNKDNLVKYEEDLISSLSNKQKSFPKVEYSEIEKKFYSGPFRKFNLKSLGAKLLIKSIGISKVVIKLNDLNKNIIFNLVNMEINDSTESSDITMSSQVFSFLVSFLWGPSTILISGTFYDANKNGIKFMNFMSEISQAISNDQTFNLKFSIFRFLNISNKKLYRVLESFYQS